MQCGALRFPAILTYFTRQVPPASDEQLAVGCTDTAVPLAWQTLSHELTQIIFSIPSLASSPSMGLVCWQGLEAVDETLDPASYSVDVPPWPLLKSPPPGKHGKHASTPSGTWQAVRHWGPEAQSP